jgi:hypothetical protein
MTMVTVECVCAMAHAGSRCQEQDGIDMAKQVRSCISMCSQEGGLRMPDVDTGPFSSRMS